MSLGTVVLTGAAGLVGSVLREPLSVAAERLISVDRSSLSAQYRGEEVRKVDLDGVEAAARAIEGGDAVVHLECIPDRIQLLSGIDHDLSGREGMRRADPVRVQAGKGVV